MIVLFAGLANLPGMCYTFWRMVGQVAWSEKSPRHLVPEPIDWGTGVFIGFFVMFLWPIMLLWWFIPRIPITRHTLSRLMYNPTKEKQKEIDWKYEETEYRAGN